MARAGRRLNSWIGGTAARGKGGKAKRAMDMSATWAVTTASSAGVRWAAAAAMSDEKMSNLARMTSRHAISAAKVEAGAEVEAIALVMAEAKAEAEARAEVTAGVGAETMGGGEDIATGNGGGAATCEMPDKISKGKGEGGEEQVS